MSAVKGVEGPRGSGRDGTGEALLSPRTDDREKLDLIEQSLGFSPEQD